jgi:hypothetical protein
MLKAVVVVAMEGFCLLMALPDGGGFPRKLCVPQATNDIAIDIELFNSTLQEANAPKSIPNQQQRLRWGGSGILILPKLPKMHTVN